MSELSRLSGVGPKREKLLAEAGLRTLRDLVYHLPRRYIDRTRFTPIRDLTVGKDAIFPAKVVGLSVLANRMIVEVEDETGGVDLVFFNALQYLRNRFFEGQRLLVAGVPTFFRDLQLVHPEFETMEDPGEYKGEVLPRYPLTVAMAEGRVEHKFLQKAALEALAMFAFTDPVAAEHRAALGLLPEAELLKGLHKPADMEGIDGLRRQLKVRELLPLAQRLEILRRERRKAGRSWPPAAALPDRLRAAFPFTLTGGQESVARAIAARQAEPGQFFGMLQGDVGAGKTVVALLAAANVLEAGGQAALMAPTEILAIQHHQTLSPFLENAGLRCGLLTGDTPKPEREALLADLASGALPFVVGTHALYSADVIYKDLGFLVIDEQHRFGVAQRKAMEEKGTRPDVLVMSATPIPQTLAQTVYGDLEDFVLKDKPAGRLPVKTRLVPAHKRADMLAFLLKEAQGGNQVFWVVPQIGRSQPKEDADPDVIVEEKRPEEDVATLDRVVAEISAFSKDWKVGAVHGRLSAEKKDMALSAFRRGELRVLVATTVIEVGVDVPQANLMVIEGPDRFGLAQLHQLRGRTGRGSAQAWCFLAMPDREWPPETQERLAGFAETGDGFRIAEMDLRQRGAGNLEGTDQSGYGGLRFTDLLGDFALVQEIRAYAEAKGEG